MSSTRKALKYMHMYVGALIGFTDIGEYDNQKATEELRAPLVTSMLLDGQGPIHSPEFQHTQIPAQDYVNAKYQVNTSNPFVE